MSSSINVHNQTGKTGHRYILIDEVQQINRWQRAAASLNSEADTHLIISGSSASLLSGDLASLFAGRYISLNISPGGRDINGVFENLAYLELCWHGYRGVIGTLPNREIDFVAERDQKRYYRA
ncbi:MAG: AAA family ATPase [Spirochaetales bacterium]|nr:AAA family ATPase [Spirochaetales bacterium]MCF7939482.1 AAA family ATPase [Spirochaetales bacterium]